MLNVYNFSRRTVSRQLGDKGITLYIFLLIGCMFLTPPTDIWASDKGDDDKRKKAKSSYVVPGQIVIKFKPGYSATSSKTGIQAADALMQRYAVTEINKKFPFLDVMGASKKASLKGVEEMQRIYTMHFDEQKDARMVAARFAKLPEVEYAEPVYLYKTTGFAEPALWFEQMPAKNAPEVFPDVLLAPNDSRFRDQAALPIMQVEQAWDIIRGEQGNVVVAIVDGGTDWTHTDLQANLWQNPGETADNGTDDDQNGYTDDINGWNFANNTPNPRGLASMPRNAAHGTYSAGLVGAQTNNNLGIAGVSWNATYMPINISCTEPADNGDELLCHSFDGIMYAAANGADIINASFGGPFRSSFGQDVVDFAYENESLVIAAAGNGNRNNNDINPSYPADYDHVLSVGATNRISDALTSFTNVGISVDVFAPGQSILTTGISPSNGYRQVNGTSFSTPIVSAIAALIKTLNPTWTMEEVREQVRTTAEDIAVHNSAFRNRMGKGRANAHRALTETLPSVRITDVSVKDASGSERIAPGELATISVDVTNYLEDVESLEVTLETASSVINMVQPTALLPALAKGETKTMDFQIRPNFGVDSNLRVDMVARMSTDGYTDIDGFPIDVNSTTHDTGNIQVTLTDQGNLGYEGFAGQSPGRGFRYLSFDFMFEGGLITGTGVNTLSDNIRGAGSEQDDDFVQVAGSDFDIIDGRETKEEGALELVDSQADQPLNIKVRLDSYADTSAVNRDFVVLKYTVTNMGATDISNYYAGLFFDWDSFDDPGSDHARYDAARKMGYFLNNTPDKADVFLATKMLTSNEVGFRAIDNTTEIYGNTGANDPNDGFTNAEKWAFISDGVQTQSLDVTDISTLLSGGPFNIPAGENIVVAFAIVGGTTQTEIETHADAAQTLWDNTLQSLGDNPVANEEEMPQPAFDFALLKPYPNPVQSEASIEYSIPHTSEVSLSVFDLLGREVKTLTQSQVPAGRHRVIWEGQDEAGTRVASGVYMIHLTASNASGVQRASQKVVLVK